MTTKNVFDDLSRRIVNDRDFFPMYQVIFDRREWAELKMVFEEEDFSKWVKRIDAKSQSEDIRENIKCQELLKGLRNAFTEKSFLLRHLFEIVEEYGDVRSNLPNLSDYGDLIEFKETEIVRLFLMDKIKR